jgi:hypothetical protein
MADKVSTFHCDLCGRDVTVTHYDFTTGYGRTTDNRIACYACCAAEDKRIMRETGAYVLYFDSKAQTVSNWPGSLVIPLFSRIAKGRHNIAGVRYDFWFAFEGYIWHGYTVGDNTQIAHCKRTKEKWAR